MDKRDFLKASGALITGSFFSPGAVASEGDLHRKNWAGNYEYRTGNLHSPKNAAEVQAVVKSCEKLKALGARHSFNGIADSTANQISLKHFDGMELDAKARTVTLGAGLAYGQVAPFLDSKGFALHNLASLPHIGVAGACSTATHGSGDKNGNLSTGVAALKFVTANGELATLSRERDGDRFCGAVVGLGALGVITEVTLNLQPTFAMRQVVYQNLPFTQLEKNFDEIFSSGYSVSLFTDWQKHQATQVWVKSRVEPGKPFALQPGFFGAKLATRKLHPLVEMSPENCTEQMGIPGPWYERMPHFRMNFTPSSGDELQSEYFVPREHAYQAILAVEELRDRITPHLLISEFRTIAADDVWMSPCYRQACMTIHFTWKPEWPAVRQLLPAIEEKLAPFQAKPHWAKLFTMAPSVLKSRYRKLPEFQALLREHDPTGKFRNEFLNTNLYGA